MRLPVSTASGGAEFQALRRSCKYNSVKVGIKKKKKIGVPGSGDGSGPANAFPTCAKEAGSLDNQKESAVVLLLASFLVRRENCFLRVYAICHMIRQEVFHFIRFT